MDKEILKTMGVLERAICSRHRSRRVFFNGLLGFCPGYQADINCFAEFWRLGWRSSPFACGGRPGCLLGIVCGQRRLFAAIGQFVI